MFRRERRYRAARCGRTLYSGAMKRVTVSVDGRETEHARRVRLLTEVLADFESRGVGLDMADNLPRDEIYDRNALEV